MEALGVHSGGIWLEPEAALWRLSVPLRRVFINPMFYAPLGRSEAGTVLARMQGRP